ncbi:putative RNA-directed DNA polymerase from transposon X-element [Trichonephila clavipes]|nr:putative RNA-directed DNA polymerase from transposon X-element [Trichonephila clavipes]
MKAQKVCDVRRITIRRDGQVLNTKHLILTFSTPDLPQTVKMAYIRCPVRPYIPNPLRCFQCQRYGHAKNVCRGQPTCPRCGVQATTAQIRQGVLFWHARRSLVRVMLVPPSKSTSDKCIQCDSKNDISSDSSTPTEPEVIAPSKTIHPLERRDFHRKIEDDTLTGDCSEDDEDLMDIQSARLLAPEEERVRHNNDLLHFLELPWFED